MRHDVIVRMVRNWFTLRRGAGTRSVKGRTAFCADGQELVHPAQGRRNSERQGQDCLLCGWSGT
eukprot:360708-Chlamydomonas_euryale.AAC.1